MTKKTYFWLILTIISLICVYFSIKYFPEAFPIVSIDLQMDREGALSSAHRLEEEFHFGPLNYKQAASFRGDREVQNFVELEAGGRESFQKMIKEGYHAPYTWTVRHFKEGEALETKIKFTPSGDPFGFVVKVPEKDSGAALTVDSARMIAEQAATGQWKIDLTKYELVEKSSESRISGRIDHTFVYERTDIQIGEGRYRLRLVVGGDKLTELTHFVKVPEAFKRRHEEMRSDNNVISSMGGIAMIILYIAGGCGVGLFFLLRQRWVIWRTPLFWGIFIASLVFLAELNEWPLMWMDYDTALPTSGFILQQVVFAILVFLGFTILISVSFMAAESLSRRAFPYHIQQWQLWSKEVASSKAVIGRTFSGYLLVGIFFAYEIILYFVAHRWLGWWTPSDILVHPDVLATYFPWLTSIAISAQAGFWEESLFRAVPLAAAALLGDRFGGRKWWIAGAMILQALIFGAMHAGYANQPMYARVVELIIPSLMFGALYLYFGLLPAIILHFAFDVVWFALPLFVSSAPGIWVDQVLVIILALVPLWIVLGRRIFAKSWAEISEQHLNRSWQPPVTIEPAPREEKAEVGTIHPLVVRLLPVAGIIGLVLWIFFTNFKSEAPPISISRTEVEQRAQMTLSEHGVELPSSWKILSSVQGEPDQPDRFIWQTAGKDLYRNLLGQNISPPHWLVRFATFEGDVAERAEEYQVRIDGDGNVFRFQHKLPEARPGNSITETEARSIADSAIKALFQLDVALLKEVSVVPSKLPNRTDWLLTFADTMNVKLAQGEARISIKIAGDQVVDAHRFVYVPEEWGRQEREQRNLPNIVGIVCYGFIVLLIITGLIVGIVNWSKKKFEVSTFLQLFIVLLLLSAASLVNSYPGLVSRFSTAQPFTTQLLLFGGSSIVGLLILAGTIGILCGMVHAWHKEKMQSLLSISWLQGLSLGIFIAGVGAFLSLLESSHSPTWADYEPLNTFIPVLNISVGSISKYIIYSVIALFVFLAVDRFTAGWTKRKMLFGILLVLFGLILTGTRSVESIPSWLIGGLILGLLFLVAYIFILRYQLQLIPIAVGVLLILTTIKQGIYGAFPNAMLAASIGAIFTVGLIWFAIRKISTR